jgi:hypothetical protein
MYLRNTSRFATDEVRRLLAIATAGVRMTRVAVHVKNSAGAYAGRAYEQVPRVSSAAHSAERLITLRVGPDKKFPCTNLVVSRRPISDWLTLDQLRAQFPDRNTDNSLCYSMKRVAGAPEMLHRVSRAIRHPYGGKRSPLIVCNNWREALVAIAAHESRHIYQFQHNKRRSEVDCERFAARALERYRATP